MGEFIRGYRQRLGSFRVFWNFKILIWVFLILKPFQMQQTEEFGIRTIERVPVFYQLANLGIRWPVEKSKNFEELFPLESNRSLFWIPQRRSSSSPFFTPYRLASKREIPIWYPLPFQPKIENKWVQNGARIRPPSGTPQNTIPFPKIRFLSIQPWKTMFEA